ncbi:MAG: hypothetical protein AAB472_03900 [Patescibacteria group bacterium]
MQTTHLSSVVMRRVHTIHAIRPVFSMTSVAALVLILSLWALGREVWISQVLTNFSGVATSPAHVLAFLESAFVNTRFIVQALTIVAGGALVYTLREVTRLTMLRTRFA